MAEVIVVIMMIKTYIYIRDSLLQETYIYVARGLKVKRHMHEFVPK